MAIFMLGMSVKGRVNGLLEAALQYFGCFATAHNRTPYNGSRESHSKDNERHR
jgi:hypothetical protein